MEPAGQGTLTDSEVQLSGDFFLTAGRADETEPDTPLPDSVPDYPSVSIVIPVHNQLHYTTACLDALTRHTPAGLYELILVDDASSDGTPQFLAKWGEGHPSARVVTNPSNLGFARSCNLGARAATGNYLVFLNNDTEPQPDWLQPLLTTLEQQPDIGIVASRLLNPDGTIQHCGKVWGNPSAPLSQPVHLYYRYPADHPAVMKSRDFRMVTGACLMVRRSEFLQVGGFDEGYENGWEDDDLCYAYCAAGKRVHYCAESVLIHHESVTLGAGLRPAERAIDLLIMKRGMGGAPPGQPEAGTGGDQLVSFVEERLYKTRARFHRNRARFFEKWGDSVIRDDHLYYREDGIPADRPHVAAPESTGTTGPQPLVSIVILTYNQLECTKLCIAGIERHTPEPHEIILVDNGSTDGSTEWLREIAAQDPRYRLIQNPTNLGFSKGCNQGIEAARGAFILLLNNDTVVTPAWLSTLLECFDSADTGIVGPMTNRISGVQEWPWCDYVNLEGLDAFARRFRTRYRHRRIRSRRIVGFCMLFRRELVERIGMLDERFGSGNMEDDDFCLRCALEGYTNVIAGDVFIHHFGSVSFIGNRLAPYQTLLANKRLFFEKWSRPVSDETLAKRIIRLKTLERAEELSRRGKANQAVETILSEGLARAPEEPAYYHALSRIFVEAGMFKDALDVFKGMPPEIEDIESMLLKGLCHAGLGDIADAERYADAVLRLDDRSAPALCLKGEVAVSSGRQLEGEETLQMALSLDPSCTEALIAIGRLYRPHDNPYALSCFRRAFVIDPSCAVAARLYSESLDTPEQLREALPLFTEAMRLYPGNRDVHFLLIELLLRDKDDNRAIEECERAIVSYGPEQGLVDASLAIRRRIGALTIDPARQASGESVSLCMIVKNEENNLPRCLASLKPIVDEIVIADTGSNDSTREVAELYGARVIEVPWNGDFSEARNASLAQAGGEWLLVMDADEVISSRDHWRFREVMASMAGTRTSATITTRNYTNRLDREKWRANDGMYPDEEQGGGWAPSDKVRLFPNHCGIRFENAIHEMVEPSLERLGIPYSEAVEGVWVHHYGYLDGDRQDAKLLLYYEMGKKKLRESGGDLKAVCELAIQAGELGRFEEAVELWRQVLRNDPNAWLAWFNLGSLHLRLGRFRDAHESSRRAVELRGDYREAVANLAFSELCLGELESARLRLLEAWERHPDFPMLKLMLCVATACGGDIEGAAACFQELKARNIEFDRFIEEMSEKLTLAGKAEWAGSLRKSVGA